MAAPGDVVFRTGLDDDSDAWDDSALIKAYDQAVKHVKKQIATEIGEDIASEPHHKEYNKKSKKKGKNKRSKGAKKEQIWLAGSRCRAVFTEDGQVYEAVIESLDRDAGTCIVRYLGYGNEEEQCIADLLPSQVKNIPSDNEHMDWSSPVTHRQRSQSQNSTPKSSHSRKQSLQNSPMNPPSGWQMPGAQPFMPPFSGNMVPPMPMPPYPFMPMNVPTMPPPPPPLGNIEELEKDSDALHAMLIAWYLSGYHTGYYQGLRASQKKTNESKSNAKPSNVETDDNR